MQGNHNIQIQNPALLELVEAVADLFPQTSEVREVGADAAPALFISWRTEGSRDHAGNLNWGVLFRFEADLLERYGQLEVAHRERIRASLRVLAQSLQFSYDGAHSRSLFVIDVPRTLFDLRYNTRPQGASAEEDDADRISR
ncbi:DUF3168 domain-containing protein [Pararobbsia alpina]|uniref:hypothetical protein n=1 Tax=Pararobbsia alpina TaxID=621374 RepID=UPI0039A68ACA